MRYREDGSVQPGSLPSWQNVERADLYFGMYRCMVTKAIFVDEPQNVTTNASGARVLYECVVMGGAASGQIISNCRLSSSLGGEHNFYERTLRPASKDVSKTKLADNDGDVVFVQFVQGHPGYPIIVGIDVGIKPTNKGASAADGAVLKWQYNGISAKINKDGNLELIRKGGAYSEEKRSFTPESVENVKIALGDEKFTLTLKSGLELTVDGQNDKLQVVTSGGARLLVDGKTGEISAQDNGAGKFKIKDGKVGLGTASNELVDLVAQIAQALSVATYPGFGAPASNVADYATIKTKLDLIKGGV